MKNSKPQSDSYYKEIQNYNYEKEIVTPEFLQALSISPITTILSLDYVFLKFPLIHAKEANFKLDRLKFFHSKNPKDNAKEHEVSILKYSSDKEKAVKYTHLRIYEDDLVKIREHVLGINRLSQYEFTKLLYPNAKLYYNYLPKGLGNLKIYIDNANLFLSFSGKIAASNGVLGYINSETINSILDKIKNLDIVRFNNDIFLKYAEFLCGDIVIDFRVNDLHSVLNAFSSYLPLRTTEYATLQYPSSFLLFQRGRGNHDYEFSSYAKCTEIRQKGSSLYKKIIGNELINSNNILRLELRTKTFQAAREFCLPHLKAGQPILFKEILQASESPIRKILEKLEIIQSELIKARGKFIANGWEFEKIKHAELERMYGCLYLLELNNGDLNKVRSLLTVESGKKLPSNYLNNVRDRLQRYITCFMPRTIAVLCELLENLPY